MALINVCQIEFNYNQFMHHLAEPTIQSTPSSCKSLRRSQRKANRISNSTVIDLDENKPLCTPSDVPETLSQINLWYPTSPTQKTRLSMSDVRWTSSMKSKRIMDDMRKGFQSLIIVKQGKEGPQSKISFTKQVPICEIDANLVESSGETKESFVKQVKKRGKFGKQKIRLNKMLAQKHIVSQSQECLLLRSAARPTEQSLKEFIEVISLENDEPPSKKLAFSLVSERQIQKNKKYAKRQAKNAKESNVDSFIKEWEIQIRFRAAKYRFDIPKCNQTLQTLAKTINNTIHLGRMEADYREVPTIKHNSWKHKVFVESLRAQLKKRKFVYLD